MTHPDPEHVDSLVITHLEGNTPGLDVGYAEAPENPSPAYPYLVATPLTAFSIEGSLNSINELQDLEYQVTAVGLTAQQARGGIAAARDRMLTGAPDLSAASYKVTGDVKISVGPSITSDRADQPPLFLANETYRFKAVPA
jgi:hypothetical protein